MKGCTYTGMVNQEEWDQKWSEWANENEALPGETPWKLLKRLRRENEWVKLTQVGIPPDRDDLDEWDREIENFMRS